MPANQDNNARSMKKINFNGVNIDVREFLDLIKQRVSKDMKHASLSVEHHRRSNIPA